jgi:hypothetical protein
VIKRLSIALVFLAFLGGCGGTSAPVEKKVADTEKEEQSKTDLNEKSVRMFTMPTPMQTPALLRNAKIPYAPDMMLPITNQNLTFFKSSIVLGAYLMDLGYASSYNHQQGSLDYFAVCQDITNDLGLGLTMPQGLQDRFKKNINAPDSLGRMILKIYDGGHKVLMQQNKEGLGLLMIMGCFMEGLHLNVNHVRQNDLLLFVHLLNQNKHYASNLHMMLEQYEIPTEASVAYTQFSTIQDILSRMDVPTIYDIKSGQKSISNIKPEDIATIRNEIKAFRTNILQ